MKPLDRRPELGRSMRVEFAFAIVAFLVIPRTASAQPSGINLSWDTCGSAGQINKSFACDTNSGSETLVGSVVFSRPSAVMQGTVSELELQVESTTLPAWWSVAQSASACRLLALTASYDEGATVGACAPLPFRFGVLVHSVTYASGYQAPNRARASVFLLQPDVFGPGPVAGLEYHAFRLTLAHSKTVGTGACAGCGIPACISLRSVTLEAGGSDTQTVTIPLTRAHVTWQSASDAACAGATPARNDTWGAIKALYR